jgi:hypothetical protein
LLLLSERRARLFLCRDRAQKVRNDIDDFVTKAMKASADRLYPDDSDTRG